MDVTGTVEVKSVVVEDRDQEFTVEIDGNDLWLEIEDSVGECADAAISNYMDYYEHDVDFTQGASELLGEYRPGNGCSLARDFEMAVQGAVLVNGWLADQVGSPDRDTVYQIKLENTAQLSERNQRRITALEDSPPSQSQEEIRKLVRSEVRMALAAALTTLTNGEEL